MSFEDFSRTQAASAPAHAAEATDFPVRDPLPPSAAPARSIAVGAGAAAAVTVEYQNALLLLPLGVFYLLRVGKRPRHLGCGLLGATPIVAVLLAYHEAAFGSPFLTGYSFLASSFKHVHAQGMLGVGLPSLEGAYLSLLSPAKGLFFFAPWLVLALPGLLLLWRTRSLSLRMMAAFAVLYVLFVCSLVYPVGGWTVSQRHLVPAVPFLVLPAGRFVERLEPAWALGRVLLVGLALPSIAACGLSAVVWPHYQEHLENPFWQIGWPMFRDGWVVPSVLAPLGVPARALALSLLGAGALSLLADLVRAPRRGPRWLALPAALLVAASYVGLARLPGRDQDIRGDRRFIERVYVPDPVE